ncbi:MULTISPECIES: nuclease-related domain-containing protein [unclassified Exiguobacterium]|uniref:nuclease-related domain-containing protein n=1 Tax=unclassified Exiguobacterium TaxID=2644629 RepID=UPI000ED4DA75|nr:MULTISPECIES: nuclease-related domain-containing protein [unclassified Exiguobacterium]HCV54368.1 hypothetical protein [Exiguobacterium sp.]
MLQVMTASVPAPPRRRFFASKQVNTMTHETDALCNEIRHVCRFDWMLFERIRLTETIIIPFALIGPKGLFLVLQNDAVVKWMTEESCHVIDPMHGKKVFSPHPINQSKRIVQMVRKTLKKQGIVIPIHGITLFPNAPQMRTERIKFPTGHTFKDVRAFIVSKKSSPVQEQERKQVAFYLAQQQE